MFRYAVDLDVNEKNIFFFSLHFFLTFTSEVVRKVCFILSARWLSDVEGFFRGTLKYNFLFNGEKCGGIINTRAFFFIQIM